MEKLLKLGIDGWSILLYFLNTGVLLAALTYFLYKPILKVVDERRKKISDSISEAQKLREEFEKTVKKTQKEKEETETELRRELDNMHKYLEGKRKELVAAMERERGDMVQKANDEIEAKKNTIIRDAEKEVSSLMTRIILNIVQNKVPEEIIRESVTDAWKEQKQKNL